MSRFGSEEERQEYLDMLDRIEQRKVEAMTAYMVELRRPCQTCGILATYSVYNTRNAHMGYFCAPHARRRVTELQGTESDDRP